MGNAMQNPNYGHILVADSLLYSMIFLNCNIRWGHNAKTRRASQILKEAPERWEFAVFCWEIPGTYSLKLFPFRNFELKGIFCKKGDFIMMLVELPSFRMLLLLNGLSYWSLIGLKWIIFWCSLRSKREKKPGINVSVFLWKIFL